MLQIQKRLLQEIEKNRPPLPQHPDADYDGIEEAYSPDSVRMCYQCMTRHRPSEDCAPWPEKNEDSRNEDSRNEDSRNEDSKKDGEED